jgi:hypothetical protein
MLFVFNRLPSSQAGMSPELFGRQRLFKTAGLAQV